MGDVVLICGPPGSGKTEAVRARASANDVVIDLDEIARFAPSRSAARLVRGEMEAMVPEWTAGRVWVIRTLADPEARERVAAALGARSVHVLTAPREELYRRTADRPAVIRDVIDRWLAEYRPSPIDTPLPALRSE